MSPDVERLSHRLAETHPVFFSTVDPKKPEALSIAALVADLFRDRAERPLAPDEVARFVPVAEKASRRHLQLVAIAAWLLHDPIFQGATVERMLALLEGRLRALSDLVMPRAFVEDAERREELVRTCLAELGMVPAGESRAVADDRLATLDSARRRQLLRDAQAREAEREARRRELERLRAQEEEQRRQAARTTFED